MGMGKGEKKNWLYLESNQGCSGVAETTTRRATITPYNRALGGFVGSACIGKQMEGGREVGV